MRQLATIQTIKELLPIEGADKIQLATFKNIGWQCVVMVNEFKIGEACVYFEIDSLLPETKEFAFLADRSKPKTIITDDDKEVTGYRLKTIKLKGQISQGLVLPISTFNLKNKRDGDDVTKELNVHKYDAPDASLNQKVTKLPAWQVSLLKLPFIGRIAKKIILPKTEKEFPNFIPQTDETRIQSIKFLDDYRNQEWVGCLKYDGSSLTVGKKDGEVYICSRNIIVEKISKKVWYSKFLPFRNKYRENKYSELIKSLDLHNMIPEGYAIQGEMIGESIQGNPHKVKGLKYIPFQVWDIEEREYLDYYEAKDFCEGCLGLGFAEEVYNFHEINNITQERFLFLADDTGLEGLVFRPKKEQIDPRHGRVSFKVISNKYLLKEKE